MTNPTLITSCTVPPAQFTGNMQGTSSSSTSIQSKKNFPEQNILLLSSVLLHWEVIPGKNNITVLGMNSWE